MPASRAQWKGYLKLSLVSCPIAIYPAVSAAERISFRQINRNTGNRLRQQLVDAVTGEAVDSSDKGRGYQVGDSSFLPVEDEELEVARQQARARRPGAAVDLATRNEPLNVDRARVLDDKPGRLRCGRRHGRGQAVHRPRSARHLSESLTARAERPVHRQAVLLPRSCLRSSASLITANASWPTGSRGAMSARGEPGSLEGAGARKPWRSDMSSSAMRLNITFLLSWNCTTPLTRPAGKQPKQISWKKHVEPSNCGGISAGDFSCGPNLKLQAMNCL